MTTIQFLAWVTVAAMVILPLLLIGVLSWFGIRWLRNRQSTSAQPEIEIEEKETEIPESIRKFSQCTIDPDWENGVDAGDEEKEPATDIHAYRIYRSQNRKEWIECNSALTERAACNYAMHVKVSHPTEYVKCEDPRGIILYYE